MAPYASLVPGLDRIALSIERTNNERIQLPLFARIVLFGNLLKDKVILPKDVLVSTGAKFFGKDLIRSGHTVLFRELDEQLFKDS